MGLLNNVIKKIKNIAPTGDSEMAIVSHQKKEPSMNPFPVHRSSDYQMDEGDEHMLQMIKIDFDSRYIPEEYRMDPYLMPDEDDKEKGIVVLLWWLSKNTLTKKFPPSYFYFRYGLYVDEELRYLNEIGWLEHFSLTELGKQTLADNQDIIDDHRYYGKENKQHIENSKREIEKLAENFEGAPIDLSKIKLNPWNVLDTNTQRQADLEEGFKYLQIAEVLTKKKQYEKSLQAVASSWSLGYQAHDTWMRGAIDARYLKNRQLEEAILKMGIKWATLSEVPTDDFEKRLHRVHELMAKELSEQ